MPVFHKEEKALIFDALMQFKTLAEDAQDLKSFDPEESPFDKGVPSKMVKLANDALEAYESLLG
jgi:hypothetical protein